MKSFIIKSFTILIVLLFIQALLADKLYCQRISRFIELNAGTTFPEIKVGSKMNVSNLVYLGGSYSFNRGEGFSSNYKTFGLDLDCHFSFNPENLTPGKLYLSNSLKYVFYNGINYNVYGWYFDFNFGRYFYFLSNTGIKIQAGLGILLSKRIEEFNNVMVNDEPGKYMINFEVSFFHRFRLGSNLSY